LINFW